MKQNEANRLANNLVNKFGLPIKARAVTNENIQHVIFFPEGVHSNEAFHVKVEIGWRSLFFKLVLGKFASELLQQMATCSQEKKQIFFSIAQEIIREKGIITFFINEIVTNPLKTEAWPTNWRSLEFSLRKTPLEINTENHLLTENLINLWVERFFACIIALVPLEEIEEPDNVKGYLEGALENALVNRYERSRYNRTVCINFHGLNCKVCGINFETEYGILGKGFIHVHHIVPVSQLGEEYLIDPINDLVPVCPNCHSMLHKQEPPISIKELKLKYASLKRSNT